MKVFLCGYHKIGCDVLEHLVSRNDITELAVFTHKPHMDFIPDIRKVAFKYGVACTSESINKAKLPFEPDIIASVYYRNIIKDHIIDLAPDKIFNVHPSLLPRHRGCSSVPWAIIEGDDITGVTFHYIDEGIDTGKIILQASIQIESTETQETLFNKCMDTGAEFWGAAFELVKSGFPGVEQKGHSCYHKRGVPHDGKIDDSWDLDYVERFIRAMTFPPYPYATYQGKEIKDFDEY